MLRKYYCNIVKVVFYTLLIPPIYSVNKISVSGIVEHIEDGGVGQLDVRKRVNARDRVERLGWGAAARPGETEYDSLPPPGLACAPGHGGE